MPFFNIVAASNENTVVTEYEPVSILDVLLLKI